ncbi:MAG: D-alanyl-D-alanine dipeptidase [Bacteroidales bacterium]
MKNKIEKGADPSNPYNLDIISTLERYRESIEESSHNSLVDLEIVIPGVELDIRYATENNFTGKKIYTKPKAWLRKGAAEALKKINRELNNEGLAIKIFDAYRPYAASLFFYEVYPDTNYVAAPWVGSIHNRGAAVDLTLIDLSDGNELAMPTPFDDFTEKAHHTYSNLTQEESANRFKLLTVMERYGFERFQTEWWHYNFISETPYPLMDISFDQLDSF